LMVIAIAPKPLARWRSTGVTKTTLKKLNCTLPSLPARGQRAASGSMLPAMARARVDHVVLINPRTSAIQQNFGASVASDDDRRWSATKARPAIAPGCAWNRRRSPARLAPRLSAACLAATPVAKEELPTT
jgi:hypothetical protein